MCDVPHRPLSLAFLALLSALCGLGACQPPAAETGPVIEPELEVGLRLSPSSASAGVPRVLLITGTNSDWLTGAVEVDLGADVHVAVLEVISAFHLRVQVLVEEGAALGPRDLEVRWNDRRALLPAAFVVEEGSISISPARLQLGDSTELTVTGTDTNFVVSHTVLSLGPRVQVVSTEVQSPSLLTARVHVPHYSEPGPVDVVVYNPGSAFYSLTGGFFIDREAQRMSIDPEQADQGETLDVLIEAEGAHFLTEATLLDLGTGVVVEEVTALDEELLQARIRIGNNAQTGPRDVNVRTILAQGQLEERMLIDGLTVLPTEANPLYVRASISVGANRSVDPEDCSTGSYTYASAVFYEPNDFPCPSSGASSSLSAPPHFDLLSTGHMTWAGQTDCPAAKTFDAGPWVALHADTGSLLLERVVHAYTGRTSYLNTGLSLSDFEPDALYDLETPGGDSGWNELPPWTIEGVLRNLPRLWSQSQPDYCGLEHPLSSPLEVRWDPAGTYDCCELYFQISGPPDSEGIPLMMVYPWDDGEFSFSPDQLGFFGAGGALLRQVSYRRTSFDLPGSEYSSAGSGMSNLMWTGALEFSLE